MLFGSLWTNFGISIDFLFMQWIWLKLTNIEAIREMHRR